MAEGLSLTVPGAGLRLDPQIGNLNDLWFETEGRRIAPLHRAHWVGQPAVEADAALPPVERRLAGDFFCAPFGQDTSGSAPIHGYTANSPWEVEEITQNRREARARLNLMRPVQGARVEKEVRLAADAPVVAQIHRITGGSDGLPVAHHPMVHVGAGGWLSVSPKRAALTFDTPLEPGRNRLRCPARSVDVTAFPAADGTSVDLLRLPVPASGAAGHEDFVTLVETAREGLGWSVVIREAEDDLVFFLRDVAVLPVTMLWFSNGGRDAAPWDGRHAGVLGIEDGCAAGAAGAVAARGDNAVVAEGVPSCLQLGPGRKHVIRHAIGAVPRPSGWTRVTTVTPLPGGEGVAMVEASGARIEIAFPRELLPV